MAVGAGVRWLARRGVAKSVDEATASLEDRMPASVRKAANALPGDLMRVGGAASVAGKTARRTGSTVARVAFRDRLARAKSNFREETEISRRELTSEYARYADGDSAALEALLDLRDLDAEPIPSVPSPITAGRRRFRRPLPAAAVPRMQRSYQKPVKPWDRSR